MHTMQTGCHAVTPRRQPGESRRRGSGEAWGDAGVTNALSSTSAGRFSAFLFCFYRRPPAREALHSSGDFIYVEISRATASKPPWHVATPTKTLSPFLFSSPEPQHAELSFLCQPPFILSVHPFSRAPFSTGLSPCYPVTIFGQFFTGFEFPRSSFIFQPRMFPPGKANKRVDRAAWRTRHADGNSSGNENT